MKKLIYKNQTSYFLAACCGYVFDFALFFFLINNGVLVVPANIVSFLFGATINLALIRQFIFPNTRFEFSTDLILTLIVNGFLVSIGTFLIWMLTDIMNIYPLGAKLLANGLTFMLGYWARLKFFLIKN
jgi:hypothetical protein